MDSENYLANAMISDPVRLSANSFLEWVPGFARGLEEVVGALGFSVGIKPEALHEPTASTGMMYVPGGVCQGLNCASFP